MVKDLVKQLILQHISKNSFIFGNKKDIENRCIIQGIYFIYDEKDILYYVGQAGYARKNSSIYKRMRTYIPSRTDQCFIQGLDTIKTTFTMKDFYNNEVCKKWIVRILSMPNAIKSQAELVEQFCISEFEPKFNTQYSSLEFTHKIRKILEEHIV